MAPHFRTRHIPAHTPHIPANTCTYSHRPCYIVHVTLAFPHKCFIQHCQARYVSGYVFGYMRVMCGLCAEYVRGVHMVARCLVKQDCASSATKRLTQIVCLCNTSHSSAHFVRTVVCARYVRHFAHSVVLLLLLMCSAMCRVMCGVMCGVMCRVMCVRMVLCASNLICYQRRTRNEQKNGC